MQGRETERGKQVSGRMTAEERVRFGAYADSLGLDGGAVATLLMLRELRLRRLADLRSNARFREIAGATSKITSHRFAEPDKRRFQEHISSIGLSSSKALGILCRTELVEKWLEQALLSDSFRVEI